MVNQKTTALTFNSWNKCTPGLHNRTPDCHLVSWTWMRPHTANTSNVKIALIRKLRGSLICLVYFFDILFMGVCTARHWQTSGRLMQEFNACIVSVTPFKKSQIHPWYTLISGEVVNKHTPILLISSNINFESGFYELVSVLSCPLEQDYPYIIAFLLYITDSLHGDRIR